MRSLRLKVCAALLALAVLADTAFGAEPQLVLNGVTATGASSAVDTFGYKLIRVQIWSSLGATATVKIECSSVKAGSAAIATTPWFPVATITDPTTTGEYWSVPRTAQVRVNVTAYTSGTIFAVLEKYND